MNTLERNPQSIYLEPVTPSEINNIIGKLKNSKHDVNSIWAWLLKKVKGILSFPLAELINNSFVQGKLSDDLKLACEIKVKYIILDLCLYFLFFKLEKCMYMRIVIFQQMQYTV